MKRTPVWIFDIDGTLADITHRLSYIKGAHINEDNPPDWDAFTDACVHDMPIKSVVEVARTLQEAGNFILLITGRRAEWSEETWDWLDANDVPCDLMLMRNKDDVRADYIIKREAYELFVESNPDAEIKGVFDDRTRVVEMWRSLGLCCFQVAKGDY